MSLRVFALVAPGKKLYTRGMNIRVRSLVVVALVLFVPLNLYLFAHALWKSGVAPKVAVADSCDDRSAQSSPKENPNKMLFIGCGGFLD